MFVILFGMEAWLAVDVDVGVVEEVGAEDDVVLSLAERSLYRVMNPGAPHDVVVSAGQREEQIVVSTDVEAFDRVRPQ